MVAVDIVLYMLLAVYFDRIIPTGIVICYHHSKASSVQKKTKLRNILSQTSLCRIRYIPSLLLLLYAIISEKGR